MRDAAGPKPPILELRGVVRRYRADSSAVLRGLDLAIATGEYVAIMGESGVGKSTLLNLVAGLDRPDAGRIVFEGVDVASLDDDALTLLRRRRMGFVYQAFHLLPYLTVLDNTALPLDLLGAREPERSRRALAQLEALGIGPLAARRPRELSGGEQQRVAIARALVHRPALVLADEPTGNLDPRTAALVLAELAAQIRAVGGSGILVTHSRIAAATADRTLVLEDGERLRPLELSAAEVRK
jgi:putative ABC transport system ATP-binding protein